MRTLQKIGVVSGFSLFAGALLARTAVAATELLSPIPGFETTAGNDLSSYLTAIFTYGIGLAALIAMAQLIFGAVQYTTSAGAPSLQEDAKSRMRGAIIGLVLLIISATVLSLILRKGIPAANSPAPQDNDQMSEAERNERTLTELANNGIAAAKRIEERFGGGVFNEDALYEFLSQSHLHWYNKETLEKDIRETQQVINQLLDELEDPMELAAAHSDFDIAFRYILEQSMRNEYFQDETGTRYGYRGWRYGATADEFRDIINRNVEQRYRPKIFK